MPIALVSFGHRMRPRAYELWGDYRGMTVLLFSSDEEREYGQVTRALLRAQEVDRMGGVGSPVSNVFSPTSTPGRAFPDRALARRASAGRRRIP